MRFGRCLTLAMLCVMTGACATAPMGRLSGACSGVPGDGRTPHPNATPGMPTHGPGGTGVPVELTAVARPATSNVVPLLYIFDEESNAVFARSNPLLADAAFAKAEKTAYWGEVVDDRWYDVPWLDKCSQASMVKEPLSFAAPPGGLLFMQFIMENCQDCEQISAAISALIANHPELAVRWVRVEASSHIGKLSQ